MLFDHPFHLLYCSGVRQHWIKERGGEARAELACVEVLVQKDPVLVTTLPLWVRGLPVRYGVCPVMVGLTVGLRAALAVS